MAWHFFHFARWVRRQSGLQSADRHILLCLALRADALGYCFPSLRTLAEDTGMHRATVQRAMNRLVLLPQVEARKRHGRTFEYMLHCTSDMTHSATSSTDLPVAQCDTGGSMVRHPPVAQCDTGGSMVRHNRPTYLPSDRSTHLLQPEEQSEQHASHESAGRPGMAEVIPDYGPSFEQTTAMLDSTAEAEMPPWADVEAPAGQDGTTAERDCPETLRSGPRVQPNPRCHSPDAQAILDRLLSYPELSSVLADPVEIANWHAARLGMASPNRRTVARVLECIDLVAEASRDSKQDGPLRPGSEVAKHLRSLVSLQPHEYSGAKRKAAERAEAPKPKRKRKRPKPPSELKGDPILKTQVDSFLADFAGSVALEPNGGKRRKDKPKRAEAEAVEAEPMWCDRCKVATHNTGDEACELYWKELEQEGID